MKYEVNNIYPVSIFRFVFFITLIFSALLSFIYVIISIFTGYLILAIIIFAFGVPLLSLILAVLFYILGIIYNVFAKKFGGILIDFREDKYL